MSELRDSEEERRDTDDAPERHRRIDRQELLRTFQPSDRHYTPTDQLIDEEIIAEFQEEERRLGPTRDDRTTVSDQAAEHEHTDENTGTYTPNQEARSGATAPLFDDDIAAGRDAHPDSEPAPTTDPRFELRATDGDARVNETGRDNSPAERLGVPVEGPHNGPLDLSKTRPVREWREGDPPIDPGDIKHRDDIIYVCPERRDEKNPDSGLGRPDAAPDPNLTPEQHQAKIAEQKGHAAEVMGIPEGRGWDNSKYAGSVYKDLPGSLARNFPDGVQFSDEGFPMFDRYAAKTVKFADGFRGDRNDDFSRANSVFGWKRPPNGMIWHHKEDGITMLLIDKKIHNRIAHYGGVRVAKQMGIWSAEEGGDGDDAKD